MYVTVFGGHSFIGLINVRNLEAQQNSLIISIYTTSPVQKNVTSMADKQDSPMFPFSITSSLLYFQLPLRTVQPEFLSHPSWPCTLRLLSSMPKPQPLVPSSSPATFISSLILTASPYSLPLRSVPLAVTHLLLLWCTTIPLSISSFPGILDI